MEQLRKEFENEVRAVFIAEYEDYEDINDFIEDKYNSGVLLTRQECMKFLGTRTHFDFIFEMEDLCLRYNEAYFSEDLGRGLVKIVMFWRYMVAREYIYAYKDEMMN